VATRFANAHPASAPFEHCGRLQSELAIAYAGEILDYARAEVARPRRLTRPYARWRSGWRPCRRICCASATSARTRVATGAWAATST
jgi:hypothetical protein